MELSQLEEIQGLAVEEGTQKLLEILQQVAMVLAAPMHSLCALKPKLSLSHEA